MKKLLCIVTVMSVVALTSCQKKYCWSCSTETHEHDAPNGNYAGKPTDTTFTTIATVCDETEPEIEKIETTTTTIRTSGNLIVTTTTTKTCTK